MGFRVTHLYGLTESYGPATLCAWQPEWSPACRCRSARRRWRGRACRCPRFRSSRSAIPRPAQPVPRDGATLGEVMLRGNTIMKGYLDNPSTRPTRRSTAAGIAPATSRVWHSGRLHRDQGPQQGHHHLRRREHQLARGRGVPVPPSAGDGGGGRRAARRQVGRDAVRVRHAEARCRRRRRPPTSSRGAAQHLAHYKAPRTVVFGPLPKTATGKIQKFVLREAARGLRRHDELTMFAPDLLAGKSALVTGASSGLGRHFAQLARGARRATWSPPRGARTRWTRWSPTLRRSARARRSRSTCATRRASTQRDGRARAARHPRQQRRHRATRRRRST